MLTTGAECVLYGVARVSANRRFTETSVTSLMTSIVTWIVRCDRATRTVCGLRTHQRADWDPQ